MLESVSIKKKSNKEFIKDMLLPIIIFIFLIFFLWFSISSANKSARQEGFEYLKSALNRASIQCYAVEGMYAPNVSYLENNYGLIIDHNKYIVHYEAFASNIAPTITVIDLSELKSGN